MVLRGERMGVAYIRPKVTTWDGHCNAMTRLGLWLHDQQDCAGRSLLIAGNAPAVLHTVNHDASAELLPESHAKCPASTNGKSS